MLKGTSGRFWVVASMIALGLAAATVARADDVDNPQYAAWSKFKAGSSATLICDSKVGPNQIDIHIEMNRTLKSVTADSLEVETLTKIQAMGNSNNPMPVSHTVKAKVPAEDVKETGTKDVEAMGKTYSCKVIELSGDSAAQNGPPQRGSRPVTGAKATIYVNSDVVGGIVKMEWGTDGKTNFVLSAMDSK